MPNKAGATTTRSRFEMTIGEAARSVWDAVLGPWNRDRLAYRKLGLLDTDTPVGIWLNTSPPVVGGEVLWWPCMSTVRKISGTTRLMMIFNKVLCMYVHGPVFLWRRCDTLCTSGFFWMTSYLHIMSHMWGCRFNTEISSQPANGPASRLCLYRHSWAVGRGWSISVSP